MEKHRPYPRHGDPISETAYFVAVDDRTRSRLLLVQGQSIEQAGARAIVRSGSGTSTSGAPDKPPGIIERLFGSRKAAGRPRSIEDSRRLS